MIVIVHVSMPELFEYDGWIFEYSRSKPFGPWPCKKDLEPRERAGMKFYQAFSRFSELTIEEQEQHRL